MTVLKRLRILPAVLGLAAAFAAVSTSLFGDMRRTAEPAAPAEPARPDGGRVVEELAATKFSKLPALTYQLRDGEVLFAWQIKPTLEPAGARPRDVVVVVHAGDNPRNRAFRSISSHAPASSEVGSSTPPYPTRHNPTTSDPSAANNHRTS